MSIGIRRLCVTIIALAACAGDPPAAEAPANGVHGPGSPDPTGRISGSPPRFEDYPADLEFRGTPASPDLDSHPDAARFRKALDLAAATGPDFAGHYTIVSRSCGRLCREFVVMDAATGKVHSGLTDAPPFEYRLDSRLIAFDAPEPLPGRIPCAGCSAAYAAWENDRLELIPPELWVGSAPPPPAVRTLIDSIRAEERPRVRERPSVLRPTWDRLVISARDGSRQVLSDRVQGGTINRVHVYRGYLDDIDHYLVEVTLFEGHRFILVDAGSALMTEIDSPPVVSPDRSHFVTASADLVAGHDPNRIRVYRLSLNGPVLEWSLAPSDWGAASPVWRNDDEIRFDRLTTDPVNPADVIRITGGSIRRADGRWGPGGDR